MIIYLIILGLAGCFLIAFMISYKNCDPFSNLPAGFLTVSAICCAVTIILTVVIITEHSPRYQERKLREYQLRREAIVWQMDHKQYVGGDLHEYNTEVYERQNLHNNPWFSWFEGDYVMQLELIDTGEVSQMH